MNVFLGCISVTKLHSFAQRAARHTLEMPRFAGERFISHEAARRGEGRPNLEFTFPKGKSLGTKKLGDLRPGER